MTVVKGAQIGHFVPCARLAPESAPKGAKLDCLEDELLIELTKSDIVPKSAEQHKRLDVLVLIGYATLVQPKPRLRLSGKCKPKQAPRMLAIAKHDAEERHESSADERSFRPARPARCVVPHLLLYRDAEAPMKRALVKAGMERLC